MKSLIKHTCYSMFLLLFVMMNSSVWSQSNRMIIKEYKKAKENVMNKFASFDINNRMELYKSMDLLPRLIWGKLNRKFLTDHKCIIKNRDYSIAFYDYDNDGFADQFVLQTLDKKEIKDEFGFVYDLNKDGKIDYIIYNGGLMITNDNPFFKYFYHWIDTNYDGIIDAIVYDYVIYSNDSHPNPNKIFWIMDLDKNGKPDSVDFIDVHSGNVNPIIASEGIWSYNTLFGIKTINSNDENYYIMFSEVLKAVNTR